MKINIYNEQTEMPTLNKQKLSQWISKIAELHERKVGEISYIFCNDEKILEINKQFLQHDYYTDIITFDYSQRSKIAGDLFISTDTVQSNANERAIPYEKELLRVVIHGILHLCGFKDKTPEEEISMRQLEDNALEIYANMTLLNEQ